MPNDDEAPDELVFMAERSPAQWDRLVPFVERRAFRAGEDVVNSGDIDRAGVAARIASSSRRSFRGSSSGYTPSTARRGAPRPRYAQFAEPAPAERRRLLPAHGLPESDRDQDHDRQEIVWALQGVVAALTAVWIVRTFRKEIPFVEQSIPPKPARVASGETLARLRAAPEPAHKTIRGAPNAR